MLTIGEFARETGLTAKALRLYDDLGLVVPADVDARTGYRRYAAEQVTAAGVVLAAGRGRHGVGRSDRRLSRHPDERTPRAHEHHQQLSRHIRPLRPPRRAGQPLDPGGRGLSPGAALDALAALDDELPGPDPLDVLDAAVGRAAEAVAGRSVVARGTGGTTLTAVLLVGDRALIAHVGDSRAYVVRDGSLQRLTRDHTVVQPLVEEGRLTEDETRDDPERAVLNRALGHGSPSAPDLSVRSWPVTASS